MAQIDAKLSTGLAGLDSVFKGLIPGDNLVWQVEDVSDYQAFIGPYCKSAEKLGQRIIYFRFASHQPLVEHGPRREVHRLAPEFGFEHFVNQIHGVIEKNGRGGFYVFDCLSELADEWHSDRMLGNFFMLTCPYLLDVEALAYFCLLRNHHSRHATASIFATTQVFVDVFHHKNDLYIHPLKVQSRHSRTIHMLHVRDGDEFRPVTQSAIISEVRTSVEWPRLNSGDESIGIWNESFAKAEETVLEHVDDEQQNSETEKQFDRLVRMAISRDDRVSSLVKKYFTLEDITKIGRRMVGTGRIGGKSVGMLLARAILRKDCPRLDAKLEPHDSFFIGADVFYTFLVKNGLWWIREGQKDPERFLENAGRGRHTILTGNFPEDLIREFEDMLDYFGQSPIIVRSSSLLEDNFGNAFAGKYESVFCANQGPRSTRLDDFLSAVRTIYASSMSEAALRYRMERGLLQSDEQMAILVQRVSGSLHKDYYYPQLAGVGLSFNPYVWNKDIDPESGMLRLVFGMGTRAVDRSDEDYTRVVSLSAPDRRPEGNFDEIRKFSQRRVDILDMTSNQLVTESFDKVIAMSQDIPLDLVASTDEEAIKRASEAGLEGTSLNRVLTFDGLFKKTPFLGDMQEMLRVLHDAYEYPVDVEFTTNFLSDEDCRINVVQCRPLQVRRDSRTIAGCDVPEGSCVLDAHGAVIGCSRSGVLNRIIYVVPSEYAALGIGDRYAVARLIGKIVHSSDDVADMKQIIVGPGRWGTSTPSLGVPVTFSEISHVSAMCEIVTMSENVVPDVSLGTHFFNDLVESDITYFALFPQHADSMLDTDFFEGSYNKLPDILPDQEKLANIVRVIDADTHARKGDLIIATDAIAQRARIYVDDRGCIPADCPDNSGAGDTK